MLDVRVLSSNFSGNQLRLVSATVAASHVAIRRRGVNDEIIIGWWMQRAHCSPPIQTYARSSDGGISTSMTHERAMRGE